MKTSYYANLKKIDKNIYQPIAISGDEGKMVGFVGRAERRLSPYTFFKKWKDRETQIEEAYKTKSIDEQTYYNFKAENQWDYVEKFYTKVLKPLNPQEVYKNLGENAVLLCFEKPTQFCHRHLVGAWLEMNLGIKVDEYGFENDAQVNANKQKLKEQLLKIIKNEQGVQ